MTFYEFHLFYFHLLTNQINYSLIPCFCLQLNTLFIFVGFLLFSN
eukprot:UN15027